MNIDITKWELKYIFYILVKDGKKAVKQQISFAIIFDKISFLKLQYRESRLRQGRWSRH